MTQGGDHRGNARLTFAGRCAQHAGLLRRELAHGLVGGIQRHEREHGVHERAEAHARGSRGAAPSLARTSTTSTAGSASSSGSGVAPCPILVPPDRERDVRPRVIRLSPPSLTAAARARTVTMRWLGVAPRSSAPSRAARQV